jgi:hypothetical protein
MSNFFNWCSRNQDAITWFIIGWLAFGFLDSLGRGQYGWALFDAVLIYVNVKLKDM